MRILKNYLQKAEVFLREKKIAKPRLEAQVLFAHRLNLKRYELYTNDHLPLKQNEIDDLRSLLVRRAKGEPIAYIIGYKEFYGHRFFVTPDVLIPRPETEELVELFLKKFAKSNMQILDLCCGSGAIGVSLLCQQNDLQIYFADISSKALQVCQRNFFSICEQLSAETTLDKNKNDVIFFNSNLFDNIDRQFDAIISNPPYVTQEEFESLPEQIKNYEPEIALKIPEKNFFENLFSQTFLHLNDEGVFLMETNPLLIEQQKKLMQKAGFKETKIFNDLSRRQHFLFGQKIIKK